MDDPAIPTREQRRHTAVVIPAYNPDDTLARLSSQLVRDDFVVMVVDDGSDASDPALWGSLDARLRVIHHERNLGKGQAIKTALSGIMRLGRQVGCVATIDADGQHRVEDLLRVVGASWEHPEELVLGARTFSGDVPARSSAGNRVARWAFERVAHVSLSDTQTGLRAFGGSLVPFMSQVGGSRYEYETNVLLACARQGVGIREVPVATIYHDAANSCSHYRRVRDTLRIGAGLVAAASSGLVPLALFAASSLTSFGVDFALYVTVLDLAGRAPQTIVAAAVAARVASAALNYALNRSVVFRSSRPHLRALPEYALLAVGVLTLDCLLTLFLTQVMAVDALLAKAASGLALFLASYVVQRAQIFSPHDGEADEGEVAPWPGM